jgi:CubicO group peptidase (beta-lactamase class C family)
MIRPPSIAAVAGIGFVLWLSLARLPGRAPAQEPTVVIPLTGESRAELAGLDRAVVATMQRYGIPGASLAVARNGSLVLARGYGWADRDGRLHVQPTTLFALASVSKSLTAVTVLKLVEGGRLDLDARVFELLRDIRPLDGDRPDPRLGQIKVRHLLYHSGGWDRNKSGDPNSFSGRVAERMHVPLPITPKQLTRYMLGQPLDFDPGTQCKYSNFGYILLGLIIEQVTGQPYEDAMRQLTVRPMGLERIRLNRVRGSGYLSEEAHRYLPAGLEERQGGHLPITMASGGWLATPAEMVRFLTVLDGSRGDRFLPRPLYEAMLAPPPPPAPARPDGGHFGMGWDLVKEGPRGAFYRKNGGLPGVHSWLEHRDDGVDWALFWNGGRVEDKEKGPVMPEFVKQVGNAMTEVRSWPEVDLFAGGGGRRAGERGR